MKLIDAEALKIEMHKIGILSFNDIHLVNTFLAVVDRQPIIAEHKTTAFEPLELLPCPFCGEAVYFNRFVQNTDEEGYSDWVRVRCSCGACGKAVKYNAVIHGKNGEYVEAAAAWNRRVKV